MTGSVSIFWLNGHLNQGLPVPSPSPTLTLALSETCTMDFYVPLSFIYFNKCYRLLRISGLLLPPVILGMTNIEGVFCIPFTFTLNFVNLVHSGVGTVVVSLCQ